MNNVKIMKITIIYPSPVFSLVDLPNKKEFTESSRAGYTER